MDDNKPSNFKRMESRIQILDRLAHKWSRNNPECIAVETFDEWLLYYDSEATIKLVYIAMQEYAKPSLQ